MAESQVILLKNPRQYLTILKLILIPHFKVIHLIIMGLTSLNH